MFTYTPIKPVNFRFAEKCWEHLNKKSIPPRSMGMLEDTAVRVACIQQSLRPDLGLPPAVIAAGDHGVYAQKVSLAPQDVTWQHSLSMVKGGGVAGLFAKRHGLQFLLIDVGVKHDFGPDEGIIDNKVVRGTKDISLEAGMSREECLRCFEHGRDCVRSLAAQGHKAVIFGEMGISNTTPSAALTGHILKLPAEAVVGEGTGLSPKALESKRSVVRRIMQLHAQSGDPIDLMANMGGAELAFIAGGALEAAGQGMAIILDGVIVTAAVLVSALIDPNVKNYLIAAHQSNEPAHRLQLEYLQLTPLLQLGLCLGEGSGAILAWPLIKEALEIFNDVTSCEDEGLGDVAGAILGAKEREAEL
ncbi:nicotinate-nucleotide--dimethylbenzimidazole phosphoribosyltransferase [bacterium]|nr:nicotinate-nucleotide--dimethylbenzimidazole phosphoribosyltransferase [bacterium]